MLFKTISALHEKLTVLNVDATALLKPDLFRSGVGKESVANIKFLFVIISILIFKFKKRQPFISKTTTK